MPVGFLEEDGSLGVETGGDDDPSLITHVEDGGVEQLGGEDDRLARFCGDDLIAVCGANDECWVLLENAAERFNLSARAHQRVLRVARTIADLAEEKNIAPPHVAEALSLRCLDRQT